MNAWFYGKKLPKNAGGTNQSLEIEGSLEEQLLSSSLDFKSLEKDFTG